MEFPIRTDFRDILELEHMLSCGETDALIRCVLFFYRKIHPVDLEFAMDSMLDFYRCGQKPKPPIPGASKERAFAYEQDALLFYAAFLEQYGIDLYETSYLHWWKFRALTDGLSPETQLSRVMGYRTANTAKMSKDMRQHYAEMKRHYALPRDQDARSDKLMDALMAGKDISALL